MTTVHGRIIRQRTLDMFADLTDAQIVLPFTDDSVTFDAELDAATVVAVHDRMTSRDDADQAARADLRAKRDAVIAGPTLANVAALAVAEANYQLGE